MYKFVHDFQSGEFNHLIKGEDFTLLEERFGVISIGSQIYEPYRFFLFDTQSLKSRGVSTAVQTRYRQVQVQVAIMVELADGDGSDSNDKKSVPLFNNSCSMYLTLIVSYFQYKFEWNTTECWLSQLFYLPTVS